MTSYLQPGRRLSTWAIESLEDRCNPTTVGMVDPTFGVSGLASAPFPYYGNFEAISAINAMAVQPDGKIVVVGRVDSPLAAFPYNLDFGVARFNANGTLDSTFGNNGMVRIPFDLDDPAASQFNDNNDVANAVAILPTGKIVIGGTVDLDAFNKDIGLVELNANGSINTSFGTKGYVHQNVTNQFINANTVNGLAIQSNGDIVTVGSGSLANVNSGIEVVRFTPNGALDTTFNGTGSQVFSVSGQSGDVANAVTIQPNGQIDVAATINYATGADIGVLQFNANGTQNVNFAGGGVATGGFGPGGGGAAKAIALTPSGGILVAGSAHLAGAAVTDFAVLSLNPTGTRNQGFGSTGVGESVFPIYTQSANNAVATGLMLESNGSFVVSGTAGIVNGDTMYGAVRLSSTGSLDLTFGTGGYTIYDTGVQSSVFFPAMANAGALGKNGEFLIGGGGSTGMVVLGLAGDGGTGSGNTVSPPPALGYGGGLLGVSTDGAQLEAYGVDPTTLEYGTTPVSISLSNAFPGYTGPVRVAVADVNGDSVPDFVVVTGPGTPTQFCVISGTDQTSYVIPPTPAFPGSSSFTGGGFVTTGNWGYGSGADIVITPDQGGGPRVVIYALVSGKATVEANFYGITDPNFRGGARAAAGDINGDGTPDLVVSAGYGGGPRIAVFNGATLFTTQTKLINDFYAFSPLLSNGAYVAVGDVNGDGYADLIFGAGEGGAPEVLVISGKTLLNQGARVAVANPLANFYMDGDTTARGGVRVTTKNVDGSNQLAIVAASGAGEPSTVNVYLGSSLGGPDAGEPEIYQTLVPYGSSSTVTTSNSQTVGTSNGQGTGSISTNGGTTSSTGQTTSTTYSVGQTFTDGIYVG